MSWQATFIVNCSHDIRWLLSDSQEEGLRTAADPLKYLQVLSRAEGLKFESLVVEFKKAGTFDSKDVQKIVELSKAIEADSAH